MCCSDVETVFSFWRGDDRLDFRERLRSVGIARRTSFLECDFRMFVAWQKLGSEGTVRIAHFRWWFRARHACESLNRACAAELLQSGKWPYRRSEKTCKRLERCSHELEEGESRCNAVVKVGAPSSFEMGLEKNECDNVEGSIFWSFFGSRTKKERGKQTGRPESQIENLPFDCTKIYVEFLEAPFFGICVNRSVQDPISEKKNRESQDQS